jgi:hypothetical protein
MSDIRQDLEKMAGGAAAFAKEASYVAIGAAVLGFNKAQVRRQELGDAVGRARRAGGLGGKAPDSFAGGREEMARRARDFDATVAQVIKVVDSTLEPVIRRFPDPVQAAVHQAREARDELRARVFGPAA